MTTRRYLAAAVAAGLIGAFALTTSPGISAAPPAAFTGTNAAVDGPGTCLNGPGDVNCNIYTNKNHVWLNAGPLSTSTGFGDGEYFFVVLEPGGGVNDGDAGNLSDLSGVPGGDDYANRVFTISNGTATYGGTHLVTDNATGSTKIRLMPYDDTSNPGGEYRIAICRLGDVGATAPTWDYPAGSNQCKRDNFKVEIGTPVASPPSVTKNVVATYDEQYAWSIVKTAGTPVIVDGYATIPYTVTVTPSGPTRVGYELTGTIEVSNPNDFDMSVTITDTLNGASQCLVDGEAAHILLVPANDELSVDYTCTVDATTADPGSNSVTITWADVLDGTTVVLPGGEASDTVPYQFSLDDTIDECVDVDDLFEGSLATELGTACVGDDGTIDYDQAVKLTMGCEVYDNTATLVTNDTGTSASANASVEICGPNGLTMGFWQNKNGQALIGTDCAGARNYLLTLAPFQDLSEGATCTQVKGYVTRVIKAANASGASMNAMLKAQMLATALDVHFSATNAQYFNGALAGYVVDLTDICATGYGTSNCDISGAFGGAASMTVSQMLAFAASQSNVGGTVWYGQVKPVQEWAKNGFDAINNSKA